MPLTKELREFVESLNSSKVEYLIVGAFAVAWHGFPRYSGDIDFLIRPTVENAARTFQSLRTLGFAGRQISRARFSEPANVIQLGFELNRIDLMTSIPE